MLATIRKSLLFLPVPTRWRWAALIPFAMLLAAMEAVGAGAVFALIKIIGDPSAGMNLHIVSSLYGMLPWRDDKMVIQSFTILIALFYIVKNVLLGGFAYVKSRLSRQFEGVLAKRMVEGYLRLPYALHLRRNSAELIRNATRSVEDVFSFVMGPTLNTVTEILVVVSIVAVLMATAPWVTLLTVGVLFSVSTVLLTQTRRVIGQWGTREEALTRATLQNLQQSIGGLKEVKVMGREGFFYDAFSNLQDDLCRVRHRFATLSDMPHLLVETIFILGLLLVILLVTNQNNSGPNAVPLLGLYAYAGFRIIPSVNRILRHLSSIHYGAAAVNQLHRDIQIFDRHHLDEQDAADNGEISFTEKIELAGIFYTYNGSRAPVLHDINLMIRKGESVGIVGPTGAGKSTLINIILGLLRSTKGRILVDGRVILGHLKSWQRKIGYVPQDSYLIDDTLRRNIAFGLPDEEINEDRVCAAVCMAQLNRLIASLPEGLGTFVGERGVRLSGGERQRIAIARALYHDPELLVFDEATSALDSRTEQELASAIEALHGRKTLLVIAHRLGTVRNCDRLVFLCNGRIDGYGTFDDLLQSNLEFRKMVLRADQAE